MVGSMVVWDIAAILLIVATPLVLIVADRYQRAGEWWRIHRCRRRRCTGTTPPSRVTLR
jgi:hypothetical protein